MKTPTTPHDSLFKAFMTVPETARDFLDIHLPGNQRSPFSPGLSIPLSSKSRRPT